MYPNMPPVHGLPYPGVGVPLPNPASAHMAGGMLSGSQYQGAPQGGGHMGVNGNHLRAGQQLHPASAHTDAQQANRGTVGKHGKGGGVKNDARTAKAPRDVGHDDSETRRERGPATQRDRTPRDEFAPEGKGGRHEVRANRDDGFNVRERSGLEDKGTSRKEKKATRADGANALDPRTGAAGLQDAAALSKSIVDELVDSGAALDELKGKVGPEPCFCFQNKIFFFGTFRPRICFSDNENK